MRPCLFLLTMLFLAALPSTLQTTVINVPGDVSTIQGGINACEDGDTVMVWPGTYYEHDIDFLGKAIVVMSTDPGNSEVVAATIVDGNSLGSVFVFQSGEDTTSVVAGLTITDGYADYGGGIFCEGSSPVICNSMLSANSAYWDGGGMYNYTNSPIVIHCTFSENSAAYGGGISNWFDCSPTVSNCTFSGNSANYYGGGMYNWESSPTVTNCMFLGNSANSAAGMYNYYYCSPIVTNCTFSENSAKALGGGIYNNWSGKPTVTNCILWANVANIGAAIYNVNSSPIVTYSDVEGGYPGEGNIDADPHFMTYKGFDYLLDVDSPCIDTGDPSIEDLISDWHPLWPVWLPNGSRSDMGAFGGPGNKGWIL